MNRIYLNEGELPFCKGCGHTQISENLDQALQQHQIPWHDVILVTDIGCLGIIDKSFKTHTVHGLHGRSVALAAGISLGLDNPAKKVVVYIGDGGATIGMQHLIDAAHKNFSMTVVLHNNMLYGMTGGQPSDLTPMGLKTPTQPEGSKTAGFDICNIVAAAGASFVSRVLGIGNISDHLALALSKKGFSLIEVMEVCPSYAVKSNPGMKLRDVVNEAGLSVKVFADHDLAGHSTNARSGAGSLIDEEPAIPVQFSASLVRPVRIMISGSAGEGVQQASELFARAAISAGLNVTKKGSYPVTVGIGFSSSEIILSPEKILYTGSPNPDYLIITSQDGLDYSRSTLDNMKTGLIILDASLPSPDTSLKILRHDFRKIAGAKNAALYSLLYFIGNEKIFPVEAMVNILKESKLAAKIDWASMPL